MPGSSQIPVSCRAWLESRSRVQHYPSTISFLWIIAGIGDALREERHEEAYLRCLLGLAAGDQLSIDRGKLECGGRFFSRTPRRFPPSRPTRCRPAPRCPSPSSSTHGGWRSSWLGFGTWTSTWRAGGSWPVDRVPELAEEKMVELLQGGPRSRRPRLLPLGSPSKDQRGRVATRREPRPQRRSDRSVFGGGRAPKGTAGLTGEEARDQVTPELVRVPGSGAKTVDPVALWKALPRLLLSCDNSFAQFFSSYFDCARDRPSVGRTASSPWPMPLPYFGASAEREKLCERLPSGRADHALHVAVNLVVAALSWLHLGRPEELLMKYEVASLLTMSSWLTWGGWRRCCEL